MSNNEYHCIGRGGCGTVWALPMTTSTPISTAPSSSTQETEPSRRHPHKPPFPTPHVLKRADGDTWRSLPNDMAMHRCFLSRTSTTPLPFLVPHSYTMLSASDAEYPRNLPADRAPCETYVTERIPPLPLGVRSTLINRYCPDALRASVRRSRRDEDCLVRLYCGRRRGEGERARQKRFFTLRNYGLCIDQMEDLGVDVDRAVNVLAKALASCYWVAQIDANDCEWVFGSPRAATSNEVATGDEKRMVAGTELFNFEDKDVGTCEDMVVWMLDFDCVQPMTLDQKGVQQAVEAFYRNDPYFPRPWANEYTAEDGRIWGVFSKAFLDESDKILRPPSDVVTGRGSEPESGDLAWLWVKGIEREGRTRAAGKRVENV